jgi:hypothetical protein
MTEVVVWKTSPWDHHVHAFRPDMIGEVTAEAVCSHSALASRLVEPGDIDRKCMGCLLLHGDGLADEFGDQDRYAT